MKYLCDTFFSPAYWKYVIFSRSGAQTILAIFGALWLFVEMLDFFKIYTRDQYGSSGFVVILLVAAMLAILFKRPIRSVEVRLPEYDVCLEVRIGDLFEASGAVVISTNTNFEADVAGGKIDPKSLQGQFTARYFTGDQNQLIQKIGEALRGLSGPPYPLGTTIPVNTHGKTFYFLAMAELNEHGTAHSTLEGVNEAMQGLWSHVRASGTLQELAVPILGTARGRLNISRKNMIEIISQSFVETSRDGKFTDRLVIVVHPEDASRFQVNLYEIKDHLEHSLGRR